MGTKTHFKLISDKVDEYYRVAEKARSKGFDPVNKVETPIAISLAEKSVGLISVLYPQLQDKRIVNRILELEKEYGQLTMSVSLKIAEEIAKEKYCKFKDLLEAIDAGIRVGFAYTTLGVVSSPIEGFTGLKLGKTKEGKDYFKVYFSGPIRSAGTTASCVVLMIIDYLRETFGFAKFDPNEDEVKRYVTENFDYHDRVTNLQYLPTEEEIIYLAKHLPIQIAGEPTESKEVSNYKDLERVETNFIRGGMCLIFSEGLAQKAQKGLRLLKGAKEKGFVSTGWDFLDRFLEIKKKRGKKGKDSSPVYIKDLVAGRPVFGHPGASGGFRMRYGRSRVCGFSATSVHPATMAVTDNFISFGTQLKIEKPTKGCAVSISEGIDGPIVKLNDGGVRKLKNYEETKKIYPEISEIIYLGDILIPFGDVANRNYDLIKPGYVEEWWELELIKANGGKRVGIDKYSVDFEQAVKYSKKLGIPLYPKFIFYWNQIKYDEFLHLIDWLARGNIDGSKLILPYTSIDKERFVKGKRALELIGCEHEVSIENVILNEVDGRALLYNLGLEFSVGNLEKKIDRLGEKIPKKGNVLDVVDGLCELKIKDKAGTYIGARMGRPEKAKLRKLTGSPHTMFPVGEEGGRLRSFQAAIEVGSVKSDFPLFYCSFCKRETVYGRCEVCGKGCKKENYCVRCGKSFDGDCPEHGKITGYKNRRIDIKHYFDCAKRIAKVRIDELPAAVKGVRGTSSEDHICEHLAKGLLRAKYNLNVNKDGTIRYDMTEMPLTHFKPKEIETSIEKLKELGYEKDVNGNLLKDENQILEIFPHDIVLSSCPVSLDEKADNVFLKVSKFVDDELELLYGESKYFNAKNKSDLIGTLFACIAPHICTAVVGRLIGFSKSQSMLASPFMHAAMRRDCLGYDNYISLKDETGWKVVKIGEYIDELKPNKEVDNFGTLEKRVANVTTQSKISQNKIIDITKHKPSKMFRIFLEDGRKLDLTKNHRVYLKGGGEKKAFQLNLGDKLVANYKQKIMEKEIDEIFLPEIFIDKKDIMIRNIREYLEKFEKIGKHDNFSFRDSFPIAFVKKFLEKHGKSLRDLPQGAKISIKRDNISLPIKFTLDDNFLEVLGLYIAEGYSRKGNTTKGFYQVSISGNEEIKEKVKKVFYSSFKLKKSYENSDQVVFSSKILYELFNNYFKLGKNAKTKRIPSLFLDLKKEKLASLLRGYFEGDGGVSLSDVWVSCDSISEGLRQDLSFALSRFGIFTKFYEYESEPGSVVRNFYLRKGRKIPKFKITKIIILSNFVSKFRQIGFLSKKKNNILNKLCKRKIKGTKIDFDDKFVYPKIVKIEDLGDRESYCLNVSSEHNFFANGLLVHNCDGDEAAVMLLMDMLLNFSRSFLPAHRGGTQDAPLVLNSRINAGEVDDQILDLVVDDYPLELYEMSEQGKHSSEIKIGSVKDRLKEGRNPFVNIGFTHDCDNFNSGVVNSAYKLLPTMQDKVGSQMNLCRKIRAVDTSDVARLIIERHFIRDIRGNLRKFSMQVFRCVGCNEKFRRPPLTGKCTKCGGRIIFTISEGSIMKYVASALNLAENYNVSPYLKECLDLVERYIETVFGKEKEKQERLGKWF